ncbi:hypothetical protein [Mesobacillus zeae]|uniref:Uncharacterized protein n=1 Tax=Mesobacillus zeae TaxID=1917180 RepID=A0A398B5R5_9BACI|nr:hypothetical protein [Mesobacillus zeae]RID85192.1 hypothetical protein D1970_10500 [Mesobacillus zeae]
MEKFTHVKCLKDVLEDDTVIFKKDEIYKIMGFDYKSLVYYIEPEYYPHEPLPEEFAISPIHPDFKFLVSFKFLM